ncbi:RteC protein [Lutibacter agarilyticus]|uniref:RteC protein n=1 Tax=Lutibacter agarilyticus TaxID=1109740 RepID=A0A238WDU1_9FLAO|nr:RteC domain-containing protein [Lutibacter agarilyticus]SNR43839.1 RteC protein [Lutibacter agarilyticus]
MKKTTSTFNRYKKTIAIIEKSNLKNVKTLKQGITISREYLNEFSSLVRSKSFPSKKEEITFFKYQKPYVEGRLQYFKKVHNYLLEKPVSGISKQQKYINNELNKLDSKKCKQLEFVKYYRLNEDKLDHLYFLRGIDQLELFVDTSHHFKDPLFTTSHDFLVSKIIAHDLLIKFYEKELELLKNKNFKTIIEEVKPDIFNDLQWTGTKTELIELIFALNVSGCFRNGNADIKKIVKVCEELFNLDLGNIHKTFNQIKARKKDSTKFLDKLVVSLSKEITFEA